MSFPESGAIFMASKWTREECLERKLFGLPAKYIDFVVRIKTGMLLFLFDFDNKELYGVFEASSDGGFNLVPDAYKSSKLKFPAQVRVNILWHCTPLQEDVFHDAIKENYFAKHKFNFGLSTEQVCSLLILFKETKLSIQRSHMSEGYYQRPNKIVTLLDDSRPPLSARELKPLQEANDSNNLPEVKLSQTQCGQGRDICNLTTMKSLPKSMPKKLASVVVYDPKLTPDRDCSIPFPSLEPAESEDPLRHEPVLKLTVCSPGLDEPIDDSTGYQVYEKNHMSINSRASVLYSDNRAERLSVFKRLSGWSKVIEQKSGRVNERTEHLGTNSDFENTRDSLKRLDTKRTIWHSHVEKASINTSVVSGLGNDVKMGAKNEPENLSDTNVEICKDSKRKDTFLADKQQKRKCLWKTKTCDELSDVPSFSQGICKTETNEIVTGDAVVTGPSFTKPFICGGDEESFDDKLDHSIQLRTSCDQDPVELLLAQYKDYLSRSRMEDQSDIYGANTCVTRG